MDINPRGKSKLLYQRGDKKTNGVVDLRSFAGPKVIAAQPTVNTIKSAKKVSDIRVNSALNYSAAKKDAPTKESKQLYAATPVLEIKKIENENKIIQESKIEQEEKMVSFDSASLTASSTSKWSLPSLSIPALQKSNSYNRKSLLRFAISSFMIPIIIFSFSFVQNQFENTGKILGVSTEAYNDLKSAGASAIVSDFAATSENFDSATLNFAKARETINGIGFGIGETIADMPINTPLSTGQNLASAGENISLAGKDLSDVLENISAKDANGVSEIDFNKLAASFKSAADHLSAANYNLQKVDTKYIPQDMQEKITLAKETLPVISKNFQKLSEDFPLIAEMLGGERSQKYLLLFQNNSEIRATGGFIGSYGILDMKKGKIASLTIDGIFNPDGQLKEKIIPPMPIQKISASWSMHDANWFSDFPTSAKKIALLYEKTGGPTVDGVIAVTPETIKSFLEITGPIEMPQYGVTITSENFIAETQNQVENLYNKEENRPKKILSDLAPILMDKLLKHNNESKEETANQMIGVIEKIETSLKAKHILIYHREENIENILQKRGWGGEIIQNQKGDYLSVINSNINGYKTDAVIEESIKLETEIQQDGTVIDTVTIKRKHLGGDSEYDWYNRVNSDYMRVYVPKGSILLEASGNTVEEYNPPMDYSAFKTDPDVQAIESTIKVDPDSQTQIFEETGKTVFGNWVYVSPKEEVTITYKYELPFKINFSSSTSAADAYSAIIQKQSGSIGSDFAANITIPNEWKVAWKTTKIQNDNNVSQKLTQDLMYGEIFLKN